MTRFGSLKLLFGCLWLGHCVGGVLAEPAEECANVERVVLECGLELVVFDDPSLAGQPVQVWARMHRGSMSERASERGASMCAARAAMYGVGGRSHEQMLEFLEPETDQGSGLSSGDGGGVLVQTDHVSFMFEVEAGDEVGDGLVVARELVDGFEPSDEAVERARVGMIDEIRTIEEKHGERWAYFRWLPELLDGSGFSRLPLPGSNECARLDGDTVRGFIAREWVASQASVLVVGDVDTQAVISEARRVFDGCDAGSLTEVCVDPIIKDTVAGRMVSMGVPEIDGSLVGMVWFDDEREIVWNAEGLGENLVLALAGEAMRFRLNQMLTTRFGYVNDAQVEVGILMGRVRYGQFFAEIGETDRWKEVLSALEGERIRLIRDGVGEAEVDRAREQLAQEWGYEIDHWKGSTSRERARVLSWLLASGRPLVDLEGWLDTARGTIQEIGAGRVNHKIRTVFDSDDPAVVVLLEGEDGAEESEMRTVLDSVDETEITALVDWLSGLRGPILDRSSRGGRLDEISMHQASGAVRVALDNGVVIRHRRMDDAQSPVSMTVHIEFESIEEESMHGVGDVFATAIDEGMIRSRTIEEIRGLMVEEGIEMNVTLGARGVDIGVEMGAGSFERGAELIGAILKDLRIEQGLIDSLAGQAADGDLELGAPIGGVEIGIGRALGVRFGSRNPSEFGELVTARSVRSWVRRAVRGDRISIGIAGDVDFERAADVCALYFGEIPAGLIEPDEEEHAELSGVRNKGLGGNSLIRVVDPAGGRGVMVGFSGCDLDELNDVRALIVGGMVLNDRLESAVVKEYGEGGRFASGTMILDLVPGRVVVFGRVDCDDEDRGMWRDVVSEIIEDMSRGGIGVNEVDQVVQRIDRALEDGIDRTGFWASRLANVGQRGEVAETVWGIRKGYRDLTASTVGEVFGRWYLDGEHFVVDFLESVE